MFVLPEIGYWHGETLRQNRDRRGRQGRSHTKRRCWNSDGVTIQTGRQSRAEGDAAGGSEMSYRRSGASLHRGRFLEVRTGLVKASESSNSPRTLALAGGP